MNQWQRFLAEQPLASPGSANNYSVISSVICFFLSIEDTRCFYCTETWHYILHLAHCTLHRVHCAQHTTPTHYKQHTVHYTLHTPHYTMHTAHYKLNTEKAAHKTRHTTHCTLYTAHLTLRKPRNSVTAKVWAPTHIHSLLKKQACCAGWRRKPFTAEAPPIGKIHPLSKIAVTFKPVMRFWCPLGL